MTAVNRIKTMQRQEEMAYMTVDYLSMQPFGSKRGESRQQSPARVIDEKWREVITTWAYNGKLIELQSMHSFKEVFTSNMRAFLSD
jgi:hypothetical protein